MFILVYFAFIFGNFNDNMLLKIFITVLISIIFLYKLISSIFHGDKASLYLTLPMSAKELVLGNVIWISTLYTMFIVLVMLVKIVLFAYILDGSFVHDVNLILYNMLDLGVSKFEIGLMTALIPVSVFMSCVFYSLISINLYLFLRIRKIGDGSKTIILVSSLIGCLITTVWIWINYIGYAFLLQNNLSMFLIAFPNIIITVAVSALILRSCNNKLTYEFDL